MRIRARKKCENACDDDNKVKVIRWKRQKGGKKDDVNHIQFTE